jgi:3-oxoacyl-[acyl-carrier-protein] synthase II
VLLRAVALGCDAYHLTAPDPAGIEETIREAHRAAGLGPDQIDLVYTHGTGTHLNDEAEATALSRVFPAAGASPALAAVKSMTGHTSGGSGLFSLVMAVRSLQSGQLPGVLHLSELTAAAQGLSLTAASRTIPDPTVAQVDAFGFGGLNAVAILQRSAATTVATGPATGSSTEEDR